MESNRQVANKPFLILSYTGKTRYLFKKIREVTGTFKPKIGGLKSGSGNDLSDEGTVKQGLGYYTEHLYNINEMTTCLLYMTQRNVKKKQRY